jgi:hypothetical protein
MRDKDASDFDLDTFVDLFDTALTSDNPTVKKAFKNLLMVTALVHAKDNEFDRQRGPLRRLVDDINNLNRRLSDVENQRIYPGAGFPSPMTPTPYQPGPTWTSPNTTGNPPPWPPNNITCSVTGATGSAQLGPGIKLTTGVL